MKIEKYKLHARNSDAPFVLADFSFRCGAYGDFDYRVLFENNTFSLYLTNKGLRQVKKFGESLLDEKYAKEFFIKSEEHVGDLIKLENKYKKMAVNDKSLLEAWHDVKKILEKFGPIYRHFGQPMLIILEDMIKKAANREGADLNSLLKNKKLANKINLSDREKQVLETLIKLGEFKFNIHKNLEIVHDILERILALIARRHHLSLRQVFTLRLKEMERVIMGQPPISADVLNKRLKGCIFLPAKKDEQYYQCLAGRDYIKWKNKLEDGKREVVGDVVCSGKARGVVLIHLSTLKGRSIPRGSVVVSGMTNPQLVPYLKNAVAIVTDEGGLTCHAAIVSRELKIPCIVGTGNATRVLKDGDLVEVDANRGIVKILNRNRKKAK